MSNAARTLTAERAELAEIRIALRAVLAQTAERVELAETRQGIFPAISAASAVFFGTVTC